jgi:hypothetical protein
MMRFLLVFFVLVASATANVIVYRGSAKAALPSATSQLSKLPRAYVVIDLNAQKAYLIFYYTLANQKGSLNFFPIDNTRYVAQAVSATKTVGTFSFVLDTSAGADVGVNMFYLRGNQTSLVLANGSGETLGNFPKTLTGIFREVQRIGPTPSLFELNFTLAFDAVQTQLGNNAFKDGAAVANDINTLLTQKGY